MPGLLLSRRALENETFYIFTVGSRIKNKKCLFITNIQNVELYKLSGKMEAHPALAPYTVYMYTYMHVYCAFIFVYKLLVFVPPDALQSTLVHGIVKFMTIYIF